MKIVDLSHSIDPSIPVFPGTLPVTFNQLHNVEQHGFNEKQLTFTTHVSTHVDAPAHMLKNGKTLDQFSLDRFFGRAILIDVINQPEITLTDVQFLKQTEIPDFILFYTGHSRYWNETAYFESFPTLTEEAAHFMCQLPIKGVGFDTPSADPIDSTTYPIHYCLFKNEILILENLTNLHLVKGKNFHLSFFPLAVKNADGFPVRAVAFLDF